LKYTENSDLVQPINYPKRQQKLHKIQKIIVVRY